MEHPPDGIVATPGLFTRLATTHPFSPKRPTVHIRTDLLFALFDLVGKTFHPRIRDLQSHVDYRLGPGQPELQVDQLLLRKRAARPGIIIERWEEMQRAAASLIHGWATSSMLISRLQAQPQQNPLAEALIEYGRILRTNHGLRWRADL